MEFGQVHHVEYYVNDLEKSNQFWNWFLQKLGYTDGKADFVKSILMRVKFHG